MSKKKQKELITPQEYEEAKEFFSKVTWEKEPLPGVGEKPGRDFLPGTTETTEEPVRKGKYRSGGQLIDNILKSKQRAPLQLELFNELLQETRERIKNSGANVEYINRKGEGIKVSKGEYRLLMCLSKLLHSKSQTIDLHKEDYYTGNKGASIMQFKTTTGELIDVKSPKISLTLYEVAKEYYGGADIGGENVKTVARLLYGLAEEPDKKALMRYTRTENLGKDKTREYFIERYDSLISIATAGYKEFLKEQKVDERREIIIQLHPVFRDQIETKHIDLPLELTERMIQAYGSPNISEITIKLILELARAYSGRKTLKKDAEGNPIYLIGRNKLFNRIAESYMNEATGKPRRTALIKKYFDKSIQTAQEIGLLLKHELKGGSQGEPIYHFTLSKEWE